MAGTYSSRKRVQEPEQPAQKPVEQARRSGPTEEQREILRRLRKVVASMAFDPDPLSGARRLRDREMLGEKLTQAQRQFWRQALKIRDARVEVETRQDEEAFSEAKREQAERVARYAQQRGIEL
jgi:hypothetical protein